MFSALYHLFAFVGQLLTMVMFCVVSGYVLSFGKARTGIKLDYGFFAFVCGVVLLIL
ncbi:hypothetical protein AGMMS49975_28220 [Clostridia bacterium]|nr:hypothetical protein AGMMS49975_28220 [Clostridia bacterium]